MISYDSLEIFTGENIAWGVGWSIAIIAVWYAMAKDYPINKIISQDFPHSHSRLFYKDDKMSFISKIVFFASIALFIFSLYNYHQMTNLESKFRGDIPYDIFSSYLDMRSYGIYSFIWSIILFSCTAFTNLWDKHIKTKLNYELYKGMFKE